MDTQKNFQKNRKKKMSLWHAWNWTFSSEDSLHFQPNRSGKWHILTDAIIHFTFMALLYFGTHVSIWFTHLMKILYQQIHSNPSRWVLPMLVTSDNILAGHFWVSSCLECSDTLTPTIPWCNSLKYFITISLLKQLFAWEGKEMVV